MRYAMAVIGVPLVVWALCLGCGLAAERLLRVRLSNALLLPLGLCVALVVVFPGYFAGAGDALAILLLLAVAIGGLAFASGGLRRRLNPGWSGLAGLAAYVLYMLPVIAYGHWTWSGYDFVNDTAFEMLLADHIKTFGTTLGSMPSSTVRDFVANYLASAYPLGTQSLLGTLSGITATNVAVLYQGLISCFAAAAAIALASATRGLLDARRAAFAGFAAIAANLTYQYALQGNIKEIGLLCTVCAALAFGIEAMRQQRPYAGAVLVGIAGAAALTAYNAVAVPYIGALVLFLGLGTIIVKRTLPRLSWATPTALGAGVMGLLAIPPLISFSAFFEIARTGQGATGPGAEQYGQLLRRLPVSQISGVWLSGEYRIAIASHPAALLTATTSAVILLAIVPAIAVALSRRDASLLAAAGMIGLVMLVVYPRVSPYAQGKLLAISSPAVVVVALAGMLALRGRRLKPAGLALAGVLTVGILASDALAYRHDRVAPTAQIEAIEQTARRFRGQGLVLWNENEEYAKYFARAARIDEPYEPFTPFQVQLIAPTSFYGHYFDLDQQTLPSIERFPIIVMRRSPAASRPPANYRLVYQNTYYEGWKRTSTPKVIAHLPLQQTYSASARVPCAPLHSMVEGAPEGSRLLVAHSPEERWFEPISDHRRPSGWTPDAEQPGLLYTPTDGRAEGAVSVRGGDYSVWVQGEFPRPLQVEVDHRVVGSVSGSNTHGQWLRAGVLHLTPGRHVLGVVRQGGYDHFGPGESGVGTVGAVAVAREEPERMRTLPPSRYRTLCGTKADWVELVRP